MNHSPLLWKYSAEQGTTLLVDSDGTIVGTILFQLDAKFICLAVNHHEELMKMLYLMMGQLCFCIAKHYAVERLDAEELDDVIASYEKGKALLAKLEAEK